MKFKYTLLTVLSLFIVSAGFAKNYYVATDGNDATGTGTIDAPYASIKKAHSLVVAGDTVFIRGGRYMMEESQIETTSSIWKYMFNMTKNGTAAKRICFWAYPGEKPIIDMSNVKPANFRIIVFYVKGSYLHFKGLEIVGTQVTILEHTQSECFRNEGGSNNIYEQCSMHNGKAIGFYLTSGSNNLVLNCDAYENWDDVSEDKKGGNVDGFGFHPKKGSTGNICRGCRAWFNSDDGYDCINASESVIFDNCWAFYNGYNTSFASMKDGNGFKAGGYGAAPVVTSLPNPIPAHTVRFCMAYRNKANGFYANHHTETGGYWYNNTAYRNSTNYNMLSQKITSESTTAIDCPGIRHILRNNVSFKTSKDTANMGSSDMIYNTFTPKAGITVSAADFLSTDESLLISPRQANGSLPDVAFLKLKAGSKLIDTGINIGFSFLGSAPDMGAFEYKSTSTINDIKENDRVLFYPNPVKTSLYFTDSNNEKVEIYTLFGQKIIETKAQQLDVSGLNAGNYLVVIYQKDNQKSCSKMIKLASN